MGGYQFKARVAKKDTESKDYSENWKEFVLFCDNLSSQVSDEFLEAVKYINGIIWFGVFVATYILQPVHSAIGRILRLFVSRIQEGWLEHDDNITLWLGNSGQLLDAKLRRI